LCRFLHLIIPCLFLATLNECLRRYLLTQRVVIPGMVITALTGLLTPLYNWLFLFK
jgi:hypothetical protein